MDNRNCYIPETTWVDYHLGKLPPAEAAALKRHRDSCAACSAASREWESLLDMPSDLRQSAAPARAPLKLRALARLRGAANRARRYAAVSAKRRAAVATTLAAVAIALAAYAYGSIGTETKAVDPQVYAQRHEPDAAQVLSRPDTIVYSLGANGPLPAGSLLPLAKETVWINERTHEIFVLLEGMVPSGDLDVQAWAFADGRASNLGLLQFNDNLAHLYSRNVWPEGWESLALTLEPKGGSLAPTTPETVAVRLVERP